MKKTSPLLAVFVYLPALTLIASAAGAQSMEQQAQSILEATGVKGGVVIHIGCGDGRLTAALRASNSFIVHGLDTDAQNVETARRNIRSDNLYGTVSVDRLESDQLPYIDNFVNLVVAEDIGEIPRSEVMRVLAP
ncbi:MAG: class I SAM-dependent methyltransferase, partial [Phycisphaerales bacterium]